MNLNDSLECIIDFIALIKIFGLVVSYVPRCEKTCLRRFANNKGTDQPSHPCRLISTFVIRLLECIISRLAMSEISFF